MAVVADGFDPGVVTILDDRKCAGGGGEKGRGKEVLRMRGLTGRRNATGK